MRCIVRSELAWGEGVRAASRVVVPVCGHIRATFNAELASSAVEESAAAKQNHHQHNNKESFGRHGYTLRLIVTLRNGVFTPAFQLFLKDDRMGAMG
jgi:hypothetical protein